MTFISVTNAPFSVISDIPKTCTVLVVGGGPGGSYTATALAREGIDVVLLEADVFPRYHIGESMLPSMRHFLRFIDLDSTFDNYGFTKKNGAAFKLNETNREGYTDFLAAGGPENYTWNVLRSEADDLLFRYAGKSGAKVFEGVRVTEITFENDGDPASARPVRALYTHKSDESTVTGEITLKYIVDASGRAGLLNTKYLKNRTYNQGLRNVASWGYWTGMGSYAVGTPRENSPVAEALTDESGWAWYIPLHTGTSIGIVMNQEIATKKRQSQTFSPSAREFYIDQLKLAPIITALIGSGTLNSEIRSASDYSYSSSSYGAPGSRVVGDAGAFIDPYFSSGVHLALTGALSAALTICAALRGDCSEVDAARWHSDRVGTSYTWFLMVVLGAYKQMRAQQEPVLADFDEDNFDRAFAFLRPVIQGSVDADRYLSQEELVKTLAFCSHAFEHAHSESRDAVLKKINGAGSACDGSARLTTNGNGGGVVDTSCAKAHPPSAPKNNIPTATLGSTATPDHNLTLEEQRVLAYINARKLLGTKDRALTISNFVTDVIGGRLPRLERGRLGLVLADATLDTA